MKTVAHRQSGFSFGTIVTTLALITVLSHSGIVTSTLDAAQNAVQSQVAAALPLASSGGTAFASNAIGGSALYVSGGPIYLR